MCTLIGQKPVLSEYKTEKKCVLLFFDLCALLFPLAPWKICIIKQMNKPKLCLALISQAGGLYGRILTEVISTDRTQ